MNYCNDESLVQQACLAVMGDDGKYAIVVHIYSFPSAVPTGRYSRTLLFARSVKINTRTLLTWELDSMPV